ncbi:hypothetical protein PIB30_064507 [Stylosanthes scabra]|uniref:Uncharacterized protein n=1 Tax=Stylosanthes scabra TaxID=79078 RepID=A0ABU6XKQ1_9FABA|nr:hypothetical protein [Stylosanthes scabra]
MQTDATTISASELVDATSISAFEAAVVASYFVWCLRLSSQRNFSVAIAPTHVTAAFHRSTCPTAPLKSSPPFVIAGVSLSVAAIASVRPCHPSLLVCHHPPSLNQLSELSEFIYALNRVLGFLLEDLLQKDFAASKLVPCDSESKDWLDVEVIVVS